MQLENIHLAKRFVFVPSGKTRFARRNIPLSEAAMDVLQRRMSGKRSGYVFPHSDDAQRPLCAVQKWHEAALRKAKIAPRFRVYDLRHTFGSRAAMAGVDLATLKELMGHSNIATTMRYVHPTPEHKRDAMEKLGRYNAEQVFALFEQAGSPQKSPRCYNGSAASC